MQSEVNHAERAHALLSASGSDRWLNCPASARLEEGFPEETSSFAEEGTLAHELAEIMLKLDLKLMPMAAYKKQYAELKKSKHYYAGMDDEVMIYVNFVKQQFTEAKRIDKDAKILIEQKFDLTKYVEGGFGTSDCAIYYAGQIEVIDLKFGKGKLVSAKDNTQLMYYALGILEQLSKTDGLYVRMTIVQPRMNNIQSAGMPSKFLRDWGEDVLKPKALEAFSGEGEQKAGDWCQFCKVRAKCRALYDMGLEMAKRDFDEILDPGLINDDELLEIYGKADFITKWLADVKATVLKQAVNGKKWPGMKLVEGRSSRVWSDEKKVVRVLEDNLFEPEDYLNQKLKGLGDLEKLLGKASFNSILGPLTIKPPGSPTLADENDKRPEWSKSQAEKDYAEDFEDFEVDNSDLF